MTWTEAYAIRPITVGCGRPYCMDPTADEIGTLPMICLCNALELWATEFGHPAENMYTGLSTCFLVI